MVVRKNFSSGARWEDMVGYSRAVQVGDHLEISGTVASNENGVVHPGDYYGQTKFILQKLESVLEQAGFGLQDVIRTRMYVIDIRRWEEVGRAHGEVFGGIRPATTMVEVKALIDPRFLVEIEISALKTGIPMAESQPFHDQFGDGPPDRKG